MDSLNFLQKRSQIAHTLSIPEEVIVMFQGAEQHYRNRMDFTVHPLGLGLRKKGRWDQIVDVSSSEIANSLVNLLLSEVRMFISRNQPFDAFDLRSKNGTFRYVTIRAPTLSSSVTFILSSESEGVSHARKKIFDFSKTTSADSVLVGYVSKRDDYSLAEKFEVVKGSAHLFEKLHGQIFQFHSQAFFQNNSEMADRMVSYVSSLFSSPFFSWKLLDLYGGVGVFGLTCAPFFERTYIIESHLLSLDCARLNAERHGISSAQMYVCDIESMKELPFVSGLCGANLAMIIDPPRMGLTHRALRVILSLAPQRIVYISCNPQAFTREFSSFSREGYLLKSCALFDMFPKTPHVELIVELVRA